MGHYCTGFLKIMKRRRTAGFFLISFILTTSCSLVIYDTRKLMNDFHTTGFLDQDHYQVIVRGKPSANSRGLVEGRKTALEDAGSKVNAAAIKGLSNHYIAFYLAKNNLKGTQDIPQFSEFRNQVEAELSRFLKYGYTAFDYYEPDNSAVLVYRIFKRRLLKNIESINVKAALSQDIPVPPAKEKQAVDR